jgi:hypothetical protein
VSVLSNAHFSGVKHLFPERLQIILETEKTVPNPLNRAPFPNSFHIEATSHCQVSCTVFGIALNEFNGVFAHQDTQIKLGFRHATVRIDQLESILGLKGVPLVDITVNEDGSFVVVSRRPSFAALERVRYCSFAAGVVEFLPE